MSINSKIPHITMELYETDICELQKFIANKKIEGEFTEEYLILYNFADDCRYSKCIQPELIRCLLPFYLKTIKQAVIYQNKIAKDIYCHFNSAIFINQKNFERAVGEKNYQYLMEYYIKQTIKRMELESLHMLNWISLFNTTIAFYKNNIQRLLKKIFESSLEIKYSFFKYLSVLLFKESDNLLAMNEKGAFWTSDIWDFDSSISGEFFWSNDIIEYFDKKINRKKIEFLFEEIKPLLCDILEPELIDLLSEEVNRSFATGVFRNRKAEYLQKINCQCEEHKYWDSCI